MNEGGLPLGTLALLLTRDEGQLMKTKTELRNGCRKEGRSNATKGGS